MQDGCSETGVSVAFTVRAMDAGPVLAQQAVAVDPNIQAPQLLSHLFSIGTDLLVDKLPSVWSGQAAEQARLIWAYKQFADGWNQLRASAQLCSDMDKAYFYNMHNRE